jgi:hypothetical protein
MSKQYSWRHVSYIIGGFIVLAFLGSVNKPPERPAVRRGLCQDAVKRQLKAPTTAKFDWDGFGSNPEAGKSGEPTAQYPYVGTGHVTAENAFGARLTQGVVCWHDGQRAFVVINK